MTSVLSYCLLIAVATGQCTRLPDGGWSCPEVPSVPHAQPSPSSIATAMDVRVVCPTSRGSGTSVARLTNGGTAIVTNHHVVAGQGSIALRTGDGRTATGALLAVDRANDLALIGIADRWPIVTLGGTVQRGLAVQFRAFDRGEHFRKYFGNVVGQYQSQSPTSAGGWFATGQSVGGNSGGGVYSRGKLVGVVWGAPQGQTAFVSVELVRKLIARVQGANSPATPPAVVVDSVDVPRPGPEKQARCDCDCEAQLQSLQQQLRRQQPQPNPPPAVPPRPAVPSALGWGKLIAAVLGVSGPVGVGIALAGLFVGRRVRGNRIQPHDDRGAGGPREQRFRE